MTTDQINQRIARAALPDIEKWTDDDLARGWRTASPPGTPVEDTAEYYLPNYCADLNAMHEAEGTLTRDQFDVYFSRLNSVLGHPELSVGLRPHICATARQRAEAFLKTIGRWTDDP